MSGALVSVYETVTRSIIDELEKGAVPWVKPWKTGIGASPRNAVSQRAYRGVNILLLWGTAIEHGYTNPAWLSFTQARALNAHVRKGEHGTRIVYASSMTKVDSSADGRETEKQVRFLKWYSVFNVEQTQGLPEHLYEHPPERPIAQSLSNVDGFIRRIGATVCHGGDQAYYRPEGDVIMLPLASHFESPSTYYATSLHEHAHWSGHPTRLDRDLSGRFGSRAYGAEELVAELAAAFLCAALEIPGELRHAGYIQSWLELLAHDKKAIFTAASAASRAADYLRHLGEHGEWIRGYEEVDRMSDLATDSSPAT